MYGVGEQSYAAGQYHNEGLQKSGNHKTCKRPFNGPYTSFRTQDGVIEHIVSMTANTFMMMVEGMVVVVMMVFVALVH
jgi:hypothetical protein